MDEFHREWQAFCPYQSILQTLRQLHVFHPTVQLCLVN